MNAASKKILIADDDASIRLVLSQAFTRLGYQVRATGNAATLLKWVTEGEGDLVVTDVVMPDENVFDVLPRIRKERFGGLLGVAAGSEEPPAFVVLDYRQGGDSPTLATSAGISMVVANFDVTLNCLLSASTFNIAGGRMLTLGGSSTAFLSGTSTGQGTLLLNAASAKSFTANGNPSVNMGNPATGTGGVVISNNCTMTDSGSFIIGNSANGVVTLNSPTAAFNTTGSAGVIMVGRNSGSTTSGKLTLINGSINTTARYTRRPANRTDGEVARPSHRPQVKLKRQE